MKKLAIFGTGQIATLAAYYFDKDSDYEVECHIIEKGFGEDSLFLNKPVLEMAEFLEKFPPGAVEVFVAVGYHKRNYTRSRLYEYFKSLKYQLASYISSRATILNNQNFGEHCFVLENNTIQPYVEVGKNVFLWSGNHIGHHSVIRDNCFISSHVVISGGVTIGRNSFIGVNASIRDGIQIGEGSVIGAGALVMKSLKEDSLVVLGGTPTSERSSVGIFE